ncbi:MAG: SDR family NAD(P)-dependent oxidoreductase, partial [Leptolyngbya sp. SIO1D8]|nr:SDR family NAD(P)-dependent oxidoreductase [Leptolyngbya sp. SIO1D8]
MASETRYRALITGASSGIGRETAIAFAKAGIDVALVSRSRPRLEAL